MASVTPPLLIPVEAQALVLGVPWGQRLLDKIDFRHGIHGCWIWCAVANKSAGKRAKSCRPRFALPRAGGSSPLVYVARLLLSLKTGESYDNAYEACHTCDNPDERCVNPWHLYWGTTLQNAQDRELRRVRTPEDLALP